MRFVMRNNLLQYLYKKHINVDYRKLVGFLLSFVILYFLFRNISFEKMMLAARHVSIPLWIGGFLFFGLIKLINTYRYKRLFLIRQNFGKMYSLISYCNFILGVLPFRSGEISYLKLLKDKFKIPTAKSIPRILVLRVFDYIVVGILFFISIIYASRYFKFDIISKITGGFIFILLFIFLIILIIVLLSQKQKFKNNFIILGYKEVKNIVAKDSFIIFLLSLSYWMARNLMGYFLLYSLGIKINFCLFLFINNIVLLMGLIPISAFFGFGIIEAGFSFFLVRVGYNYSQVVPIILIWHVIIFIITIIYGAAGFILLSFFKNKDLS